MTDLWISMKKGRFDGVKASVEMLLSQGYPLMGVLNQIHDDLINRDDLSDVDKALICEKLGEVCGMCYLYLQRGCIAFLFTHINILLSCSLVRKVSRRWCRGELTIA